MTPWTGPAAVLADRIAAFIDGSLAGGATEPLEPLMLAVHRWQRSIDPVIAALTEGEPAAISEIPAVPVGLFKDLPVGTVRPGEPCVIFRTSGTTGGGRGEHRLRSAALYDQGAVGWARAVLGDWPHAIVALLGDPARVPDASLAHMVGLFGEGSWHVADGVLDREGLDAAVSFAEGPLFVPATAFALAEWLDRPVPRLPYGSILMVTGGFKGRVHRIDGDELLTLAAERLTPRSVVTEYGMTELSSQLWGTPGSPFRPPPWLVVVAVDPLSGAVLPTGSPGQMRFYDLANLDGSVGIETMDEGIVHDDGSVTLIGRLAGAPARGCSLTVEEAWQKRGSAL